MADDLNTVTKKLMDNSSGQGLNSYEHICLANHVDYEKWNNHQRGKANNPVFKVMGQFLGYPNLITRTHEFFEKSLIYYNGRPDLMTVIDGEVQNRGPQRVCWNGQAGGLEGLRQKGWSVVNLLVIARESANRNTRIEVLAQGDNQVICCHYKLQKARDQEETISSLNNIVRNNDTIMRSIESGTKKLGLIINKDETVLSADFLIYGKVPIFRGCIKGLETKRWSRVTCVTNDQLPTLSNTMSTINSNALTVAHFSTGPKNAIIHYNFLGNFARIIMEIHNPAMKGQPRNLLKESAKIGTKEFKSLVLYLDPCLGGACGMSLTRFLIRSFPDPLTESLTFWRILHQNGPLWVKQLANSVGSPRTGRHDLQSFKKLLEDPLSINIPGGINPNTIIKEEIKRSLISNAGKIKNDVVKSAVTYLNSNEDLLIDYLRTIKPLFPRFLSEYMSGTYVGIVRSLVGLFQNSKTIRTVFSRRIDKRIKEIIINSEVQTISNLIRISEKCNSDKIWNCSATKSDLLRFVSWGTKVVGATVPHPLELLGKGYRVGGTCPGCNNPEVSPYYISTLCPGGLCNYETQRGPYKAYLGSRTSESTSIIQPWEKETKVPMIKRAVKLRNAIGWFIEKNSNLGLGLMQNIEALTGEDWTNRMEGGQRTGSALHRFSCSRQSSAGYAAQSPSRLTWVCSTTDTLSTLNTVNHDFMHQSLLIYAQASVTEAMDQIKTQGYFHHHISCQECLREIEEVMLDSDRQFEHPAVWEVLNKWKPSTVPWSIQREISDIKEGDWDALSDKDKSFHIGRAQGFVFGDLVLSGSSKANDPSIFPLTLQNKVHPREYLAGTLDGLLRAASIHCISRRSVSEIKRPREALLGTGLHLIGILSENPAVITIWRSSNFESLFYSEPHKIPASYPLSNSDLGLMGKVYLRDHYLREYVRSRRGLYHDRRIWVFSDINDQMLTGLLSISGAIMNTLYNNNIFPRDKNKIRAFKEMVVNLKDPLSTFNNQSEYLRNLLRVDREIRHASKSIIDSGSVRLKKMFKWGTELISKVHSFRVSYHSPNQIDTSEDYALIPERIQNPLISSMRLFQFATGSHYKLRSILDHFIVDPRDALCCGDGSGGIGAMILRKYQRTRIIFNSLLSLEKVDLRGTMPSPP